MTKSAPTFFEQYRLEKVLRSVLERALETETEAEIQLRVRAEIPRLNREWGPDFLARLTATSSPPGSDNCGLPTPGPPPDPEVVAVWLTPLQRQEAQAALWYAKLHGITSIPEALAWHSRCNAAAKRAPTVRACVDEFHLFKRRQNCALSTLTVYRLRLNAFVQEFGDRRANSITGKELSDYLIRWANPSTRLVHWDTLSALFNFMWTQRFLMENPLPKAMRRPTKKPSARLIFTPAETRHILNLVKNTDQLGFWVLSLFAGLRGHEIQALESSANPWGRVNWVQGFIDLRDSPIAANRRVIPLVPALRAWLKLVKTSGKTFYPRNHWHKFRLVRAQVFARRSDAQTNSDLVYNRRTFAMARRSYISYRLALTGASFAKISDDVGYSEKFVRSEFLHKASETEARVFFNLRP